MLNSENKPQNKWIVHLYSLACLFLTAASIPSMASRLSVTIRDLNGTPVAARVYLTDANDRSIFPGGTIVYNKTAANGVSERDFVPQHGIFSVDLPTGRYRLVVERGKEYVPVDISIKMHKATDVTRTIVLHRWIDMARLGWFSADMHVHRPLRDLATLMEAEDLSVAIPITRWETMQQKHEDPDTQHYLSIADPEGIVHLSQGRFFPVINEEVEPRASALLASSLGRDGTALTYPLARFGKAVELQGGIADSEKATSLELPGLAAVGACKTVGLANNHLWRTGSYTQPWGAWPDHMLQNYAPTCTGFVQAGFDMYAALLDMGFPLKLSAGSASGVHPVPPGWSRIYVHSLMPLTPASWFDALRQGRSFVTTGPMLLLKVNGKEPGQQVSGERFPLRLNAEVAMLSLSPIEEAEIVVNGVPHRVALELDPKHPHRYAGTMELTVASSTWIAARWSSMRGHGCDAAHTSPIYFWDGNTPVAARRNEAQLLLDRVDDLIHRATTGDPAGDMVLDSDRLRQETLEYLKQAREVYQRKVTEALP